MQKKSIITGVVILGLSAVLAAGCSKKEEPAPQPAVEQSQQAPPQGMKNATLIADLEARLKDDPKNAEVLWRLGDAYFDAKQFNESVKNYKKVLEVKPAGEADLYNDLGLSLHYLGNSAEAIRYLDEGIKKNPYHQRIWLTKGFILAYGMGDLEGAKAAWEKANALNPESQIGKAASEYLALVNKK